MSKWNWQGVAFLAAALVVVGVIVTVALWPVIRDIAEGVRQSFPKK